MSARVIVSAPYLQREFEAYRERFAREGLDPVLPRVTERLEEAELLPLVVDADALICGDDRITRRVLEQAQRLKVIVKWGTGIDSIDLESARQLGIPVRNTPNAFTEPVSDSVLAFILAHARQIVTSTRSMADGQWSKAPAATLGERCVGIIGVGAIGRAVARKLRPFGPRLLGTDIVEIPEAVRQTLGIEMVDLDELLAAADFVSINCTLNPTSHHLMTRPRFSQMKPHAVLVNAARGPIVDEPALVWALQTGVIGGAALDVFEEEPLPLASPLRRMPNVLMSPHATNASPRCWKAVHENSIAMVCEELARHAAARTVREVA